MTFCKSSLIVIAFSLVLFSCKEEPRTILLGLLPRDTSITPSNAFTNLKLDSLSVQQFADSTIKNKETREKIISFYNTRNYQYAWFDEEGLTEPAEAFWNLHLKQIDHFAGDTINNERLHADMQMLLDEDTVFVAAGRLQQIELELTLHFFQYVRTAFMGRANPEEMQWHIPTRKVKPLEMLDSFLAGRQQEWKPLNRSFYQLRDKAFQYSEISKKGGWSEIMLEKNELKVGDTSAAIAQLKKRLALTGEFEAHDTGRMYTEELRRTILGIQMAYGLQPNGIIDDRLIKELNVDVNERIKKILINLERMRWMPEEKTNRMVANIPEYRLRVFEQDKEVINMRIVVGKSATRSVIFSDELKYIVFSPFWNLPRSIVRNEILPAIESNKEYLRKHNMEIVGESNGLPVIRQKPGRGNALGKVKFIFPNRYNIYFHDTPAKGLFEREKRAFSHGCIRLQRPFQLARYLLRDEDEWSDSRIKKAMNNNSEKWVTLKDPLPVFIVYITSWVDESGLLNFRRDVYGHDERMAKHLFAN